MSNDLGFPTVNVRTGNQAMKTTVDGLSRETGKL